ncbi:RNase adapter RapZ, partial [Cobetia marina]
AVSIDARNLPDALSRFPELLDSVRQSGMDVQVVYLTTDSRVLLERYSATRRRHPLTRDNDRTLAEAIEIEQQTLAPIRQKADLVIDSTNLSVHDLRSRITEQVAQHSSRHLTLTFESFGFKHGVPTDADMVFDARCLPNPYWDINLRSDTGRDDSVAEFLQRYPDVKAMQDDIAGWLERWLPAYQASNRSYLTVSVGCTGGQHRSVYLCEQLAEHFAKQLPEVRLRHRELGIHTALAISDTRQESHDAQS